MKKLLFVVFAGASMATIAFAQENNNPPAEQKQAQASEDKCCSDKCCSKDCCKDMKAAKHEHGSKKDKKKPAMSCCK